MPTKLPQERTCLGCGSPFTTSNSTRKFCHNNCKSAYDRHRKKQHDQEQAQQVRQQASEINQLRIRPQVVSTEMINPDWEQADRRCQAQQGRCDRVAQQLADVRQERRALTKPGWGCWLGAISGLFLIALVMALSAEAHPRQRSKFSFWLQFMGGGGLLSLLLGWLGNQIGDQLMSDEKKQAVRDELKRIKERETTLIEQLETEKGRLESLLMARDEIAPTCPLLAVPGDEDAPNAP